jgi:hypothetical protein
MSQNLLTASSHQAEEKFCQGTLNKNFNISMKKKYKRAYLLVLK